MKKLIRWFDINFEACFGMIFFFIMLGIILMQIFLRNILGAGTAWGEEICKFCYVWVCYIGLGYATKNSIHIEIDAIRSKMPENVQKALMIFTQLIMLVLFCYFFYGTVQNVIRIYVKHSRAESINISQNWMYIAGPIGYGLGVVRCIQTLVWKFRHFRCSMPIFVNPNCVLTGGLDTYCFDDEIREETRQSIPDAAYKEYEELCEQRKAKKEGKKA